MEIIIHSLDPNHIRIHPYLTEVYEEKKLDALKYTIKHAGQLEPIKAVIRDDVYYVIDGISRLKAIKDLNLPTINVVTLDIPDDQIQTQFVHRNVKTKRPLSELLKHAEIILNILGKSQGKRRTTIGNIDIIDEEFSLEGKDRFQIACHILDISYSATTLRRLMRVYEYENTVTDKYNLIHKIENKTYSINGAFFILEKLLLDDDNKNKLAIHNIKATRAGIGTYVNTTDVLTKVSTGPFFNVNGLEITELKFKEEFEIISNAFFSVIEKMSENPNLIDDI